MENKKVKLKRLKTGTKLLELFVGLIIFDIVAIIALLVLKAGLSAWIISVIVLGIIEAAIFWCGIILVYTNSVQLGIRHRAWGIILGMVPIANIIMLITIIKICRAEFKTESQRILLNEKRKKYEICKTKYPILLVHGVFFRDSERLNYWGRIPEELEANGATVFYGEQNSAAAVAASAAELENRIRKIIEETGAEKVNIIAHSKGGLDSRAAIFATSAGRHVASLTTINTPHRGCEFADYFLNKIPQKEQLRIAEKYNHVAAKLGDTDPDFLAAVYDLTASSCRKFNEEVKDSPDVYYQWVGSIQKKATSGKFPLNFTQPLVKYFDGRNDGLVGEKSFPWGKKYAFLVNDKSNRGISHADMIDLNRQNIEGFDVREFYVKLVSDLKDKGF